MSSPHRVADRIRFWGVLRRVATDARGAVAVEYLILVGCVALVAVAAFQQFGGAVAEKAFCQARAVVALSADGCAAGEGTAVDVGGVDVPGIDVSTSAEVSGDDEDRPWYRRPYFGIGEGMASAVTSAVTGMAPLVGLGGESAPGVLESWAALAELGKPGMSPARQGTARELVAADDWANGDYGPALGKTLVNVGSMFLPGPKLSGALGKAARAADVPDQPYPKHAPDADAPSPNAPEPQKAGVRSASPNAWMSGELEIVSRHEVGLGKNGAEIATVRDPSGAEHKVIWKEAQWEEHFLRPGIAGGTYHAREAAMYKLDQELGGATVVPPTVSRELGGQRGSMQEFVGDAHSTPEVSASIDLMTNDDLANMPSLRRTFLLDVIGGNSDRHSGNIMWRRLEDDSLEAVAIDNGLSFPEGPVLQLNIPVRPAPLRRALLNLDPESVRVVRGLSLERVAEMLRSEPGITPMQIRDTLARIRTLQNDPGAFSSLALSENPRMTLRDWLAVPPEERTELTPDDLGEIDRLAGTPR